MPLDEADLLFAVRREPVANRIVFQVAHDIWDNWFKVEEIAEKPDPNFDKEVQRVLEQLDAKAIFTQATVYERLFGWAIIAMTYVDYGKDLSRPVKNPKEIRELLAYSSLQYSVQSSDEDKDPESSRFGLPVYYTLTRKEAGQVKLHFSRVIHSATRLLDHPYRGMSARAPDRYLKLNWLQSLQEPVAVVAKVSAIVPEETQEEKTSPSKKQKKTGKRSKPQLDLSLNENDRGS
jgi:hypothetical protein